MFRFEYYLGLLFRMYLGLRGIEVYYLGLLFRVESYLGLIILGYHLGLRGICVLVDWCLRVVSITNLKEQCHKLFKSMSCCLIQVTHITNSVVVSIHMRTALHQGCCCSFLRGNYKQCCKCYKMS